MRWPRRPPLEALGAGRTPLRGPASVPPVRGRFEEVDEGQPFTVLVDFAHTPAALGEALVAARELRQQGPVRATDRGV